MSNCWCSSKPSSSSSSSMVINQLSHFFSSCYIPLPGLELYSLAWTAVASFPYSYKPKHMQEAKPSQAVHAGSTSYKLKKQKSQALLV